MRRPDMLDAAVAGPGGFCHRPAGPMRRLTGRFGERHLDHAFNRCRRQRRLAARPGSLVQQAVNPLGHEPPLPAPNVAKPVRLPPGRARLATSPCSTGSPPLQKTIGIVAVAAFAASALGRSGATMTATCLPT